MGKWRSRFIERRLGGPCDEDRPGRPRSVTDEQVEQVIIDTLERTPKAARRPRDKDLAVTGKQ